MSDNYTESDSCTDLRDWVKEQTGDAPYVEIEWSGGEDGD